VGAQLTPDHDLSALAGADLVAVPAIAGLDYPREALDALRAASDAGSMILTVCSGAFVAGAAGLLDGRACTTHWMHADQLARMYPTARVDRNVLFVDDGNLITSAGTAAGIDACLHLVRRELGSAVTNAIARRMVVPPQRDGGQRQYIDQPIPVRCSEGFAPQLDWIVSNLHHPHTVATLARRANNAPRVLRRAGLTFDTARRVVTRDGRVVPLTTKELAVLEILMSAGGAVVSAEDLLERAWDEHADPFTATVRVTIARLRRKLGEPQLIETLVGAGYRL